MKIGQPVWVWGRRGEQRILALGTLIGVDLAKGTGEVRVRRQDYTVRLERIFTKRPKSDANTR